jgi:hypothetical protein
MNDAQTTAALTAGPSADALPVLHVGEIPLAEESRRFLIDRLWGHGAVGLIGGSPKSCKSWLGLDMAVSVASATPALGEFAVEEKGTALVFLAEDALAIVRERVSGIARSRGLELSQIDLHVITAATLRLDREVDRRRLTDAVRALRPRLLVLDPLVRLHTIDENSAGDVARLLSYIRELERELAVAVVLVHHVRKNGGGTQPGQALRGSGDLHAFGDSNLYLRRTRDGLLLAMEHRSAASAEPVFLELDTTNPEAIHLRVAGTTKEKRQEDEASATLALEERLLELLAEREPRTRNELREALAVKNERLGSVLEALEARARIERSVHGWRRRSA